MRIANFTTKCRNVLLKGVRDFSAVKADSRVGAHNRFGYFSRITNSKLGDNCSVGNLSKIDNSQLDDFVLIGDLSRVSSSAIGGHSYTGEFTVIEKARIKKYASISWGVTIGPAEHDFRRVTAHEFLYSAFHKLSGNAVYDPHEAGCTIGNDVLLGTNVTVLRGVSIGDGAVIGANALVTENIPPYAIAVGMPARVIKYRFPAKVIERLMAISWWQLTDKVIADNIHLFSVAPTEKSLDELAKLIATGKRAV